MTAPDDDFWTAPSPDPEDVAFEDRVSSDTTGEDAHLEAQYEDMTSGWGGDE